MSPESTSNELYVLVFFLGLAAATIAGWTWLTLTGKLRSPVKWRSADFRIPGFADKGEAAAFIASLLKEAPSSHDLASQGLSVRDPQHQRLYDHAYELRYAILSSQPPERLNAIIDTFVRDMVQHFRDEEAMLAAARDPKVAEHAEEHRELAKMVDLVVSRFRAGFAGENELVRFLAGEVLGKHALEEDREHASRQAIAA